jgi:hypothetical protein
MTLATETIKTLLLDPPKFIERLGGIRLRTYQREPVEAIVESVVGNLGHTIVVEMARQSGKNEIQAQLETYLLCLYQQVAGEMVKASPTWKPQTQNAMRRLKARLDKNLLTREIWKKESGYIFRISNCLIAFFSGQPKANVIGATASLLLVGDEAQDISTAKWDKDFAPMAASTNATTVLFGTAWTKNTLLARERQFAQEQEKIDGIKRYFRADADVVAAEVESYKLYVEKQIAKLGRQHPIIKTQYFLEEIDASGGMFPPARRALTRGKHQPYDDPKDKLYAITIDVAGEDENANDALQESEPRIDSTALTIAEIDLSTVQDEWIGAPTYRIVKRHYWTGVKNVRLYGEIRAICELWSPVYVLVDETGIGQPLRSFLTEKLRFSDVIGVLFTSKTKSDMGYRMLAAVDIGRIKDYSLDRDADGLAAQFQKEMEHCTYEIKPGPAKRMTWGVPDGTRDNDGNLVHDDLVIGAAMFTELDDEEWPSPGDTGTTILQGVDPLAEIDKGEW